MRGVKGGREVEGITGGQRRTHTHARTLFRPPPPLTHTKREKWGEITEGRRLTHTHTRSHTHTHTHTRSEREREREE